MQAAIRTRWGGPEVVEVVEIERPEPAEGQVRIAVRAASVNRADMDMIRPHPKALRLALGIRRPRNPRIGIDCAGVVDAVGPGATRFAVGDPVFGDLFSAEQGAFAKFVTAPERALERIPDGLAFDDAATLPHSAILALQGLRRRDGRTVQPGDRVLVDGASGNVGSFAVQIARHLGSVVTGTCSPGKMDFVRSLGAEHVIDYTTVDYTKAPERYDWILDVDSHHPIRRARRALAPGGTYVTLGGPTPRILAALVLGPLLSLTGSRRSGLMLWWKPFHPPDVATLASMVLAGTLRPPIERRFPLAETRDALRHVHEGRAMGKVVVIP